VPFRLVVEDQEYSQYSNKFGEDKIIKLPGSNYGSVAFARNYIKKYSIEHNEKKHWQIDDDIKNLLYVNKGKLNERPVTEILGNAELFVDRYTNIGLSALSSSVFVKFASKPFVVNKLAYTCKLVDNALDIWWEKGVIDDLDYNLKVLDSGWCTLRFNAFAFSWNTVMSQTGGFSEIYADKSFLDVVKNTQKKWGLGKIKEKTMSGNTFYAVEYTKKMRSYGQTPIHAR
jgi:hypothetical protein